MRYEGVAADVAESMEACKATALAEDNLLLRVCDCGMYHPVGHLGRRLDEDDWQKRHHVNRQTAPFTKAAVCCGCCSAWEHHAPIPADVLDAKDIERQLMEKAAKG
jgi:hypothetical protein